MVDVRADAGGPTGEAGPLGDPGDLSDVFRSDCPGRAVFEHISGRWGMLVLIALRDGPMRFYMLRDRIGGISEKMLSQNLKVLTRDGIIEREVEPSSPPRVSYRLSPFGQELAGSLQQLVDWIAASMPTIQVSQRRYDDAAEGGGAG
ncbi:winged helix-turn-helix transcriptional regulator [Actinomadura rugatobispora]|uniref:Winged helix-turn-helix transcriptional regulator n=1 Tax=Actinomadura rugatobispora TaxID=1994 RepID=A0ABW1AAX0_9ACTN|nr:helix-turn-helix domain-containing protein [Actinomadura rugatobispora]